MGTTIGTMHVRRSAFIRATPERVSATCCARPPASETGDVAPASRNGVTAIAWFASAHANSASVMRKSQTSGEFEFTMPISTVASPNDPPCTISAMRSPSRARGPLVPYVVKPVWVPAVLPPTSIRVTFTAGVSASIDHGSLLPLGIVASFFESKLVEIFVAWVSTTGDSPLTVTVSSSEPTFNSAFTVAVNPVVNAIPSRLTVPKPGKEKVTVYMPGRRSTIL